MADARRTKHFANLKRHGAQLWQDLSGLVPFELYILEFHAACRPVLWPNAVLAVTLPNPMGGANTTTLATYLFCNSSHTGVYGDGLTKTSFVRKKLTFRAPATGMARIHFENINVGVEDSSIFLESPYLRSLRGGVNDLTVARPVHTQRTVHVLIGDHPFNANDGVLKQVSHPGVLRCGNTPVNPQLPEWNDAFEVLVDVEAGNISVWRLDTLESQSALHGWGQSLVLACETSASLAAKEKADAAAQEHKKEDILWDEMGKTIDLPDFTMPPATTVHRNGLEPVVLTGIASDSESDGFVTSKAFDNACHPSKNSYWQAQTNVSQRSLLRHWVIFDAGAAASANPITAVGVVSVSNDKAPKDCTLQWTTSLNVDQSATWYTAINFSAAVHTADSAAPIEDCDKEAIIHRLPAALKKRFWRLVVTSNHGNTQNTALREIRLYTEKPQTHKASLFHGPYDNTRTVVAANLAAPIAKPSAVRIRLRYWAIDSWNTGERASIKINGVEVWGETRDVTPHLTIAHGKNFGSTKNERSEDYKALCRCVTADKRKGISVCSTGHVLHGDPDKVCWQGISGCGIDDKFSNVDKNKCTCKPTGFDGNNMTFAQCQYQCQRVGMHIPSDAMGVEAAVSTGCGIDNHEMWIDVQTTDAGENYWSCGNGWSMAPRGLTAVPDPWCCDGSTSSES